MQAKSAIVCAGCNRENLVGWGDFLPSPKLKVLSLHLVHIQTEFNPHITIKILQILGGGDPRATPPPPLSMKPWCVCGGGGGGGGAVITGRKGKTIHSSHSPDAVAGPTAFSWHRCLTAAARSVGTIWSASLVTFSTSSELFCCTNSLRRGLNFPRYYFNKNCSGH